MARTLIQRGTATFERAMAKIGPWSLAAPLATLVLLFAFQGEAILRHSLVIALLAVPILIQVLFNASLAYWLNRKVGERHAIGCPSSLIGGSNFFELAVATAIRLFGFESGAALATVVGVLIEVPVMPLVVRVVDATRGWYEAGDRVRALPEVERGSGVTDRRGIREARNGSALALDQCASAVPDADFKFNARPVAVLGGAPRRVCPGRARSGAALHSRGYDP